MYVRLTEGLKDFGKLVPEEDLFNHITTSDKDYYRSVYLYNEKHYKEWLDRGSVSGITDVVGTRLVWDFDSDDLEKAKYDTIELVSRLIAKGLKADDLVISFSGNKGFSVELETTHSFTPVEAKRVAKGLAHDLATFDIKMYNASRVFRIPCTKHNETGLYKLPITFSQLAELTADDIVKMASNLDNACDWEYRKVTLPDSILNMPTQREDIIKPVSVVEEVDITKAPKGMPVCKYMILNGIMKDGSRQQSLTALAAHYRATGTPKEITYRILKGALELYIERTKKSNPSKAESAVKEFNKNHLWNNIVSSVYSPNWKGGTYSCKEHEFLRELCQGRGSCQPKKETITNVVDMAKSFVDFSVNLDKNLIKTGLKSLDEKLMLLTSTSVGLLGSPGSGKTSCALQFLANARESGSTGLFCSLDMGKPIVFAKMAMNVSGYSDRELINIFRNDAVTRDKICAAVKDKYGNFPISFKSGQSISDIRDLVLEQQDKRGEKVKLVVLDYLELIAGPYSDATANSAYISAQIKDLSTDLETCVITLVQPQKSAGDASSPLLSMRKIKGASALEQNFRTVLSVYREGFSPNTPEDDKFITINCLKNTLGGLFSLDFSWDGSRGNISELTAEERVQLEELRDRLANQADHKDDSGWGS